MAGSAKDYVPHINAALAAAFVLLPLIFPRANATAESDVLSQAVNYVFTGKIDTQKDLDIVDRKACIVQVTDPNSKRLTRYYLGRFKMEAARYEKLYAGRLPTYQLFVEGDEDVVEFLNSDMTVSHGHRNVRIPLPGNIDQSQKALRIIAEQCKDEKPTAPF